MAIENHYRSNLRDIEFNLFEVLRIQDDVLGRGPFAPMDHDSARAALAGVETIARKVLAQSYMAADREGLQLRDGTVSLPESFKRAFAAWYDADWHRLAIGEHTGGFGAPPTVTWSVWEMVVGANASLAFYLFGAFISRVFDELATDAQNVRFTRNIIEKRWGATMVLTEPGAGSDVGAGRTVARQADDGTWHLEGVKRFITNADFDCVDNIIHLVLARPEGHAKGTKGLSLFIVPKFWVEEDGSLGERNGAFVTNLEDKMGIKASATCELTLGADRPCRALLMGDKHDGIAQMFRVIEQARMCIGVKSMSHLSTAYLHALEYAKQRVQGPDLTRATDKNAPRVPIIAHADVRRMLINLKSNAEGMRALYLYAASLQDQQLLIADAAERDQLRREGDLLLPLIKGYYSERVYELLSQALQVFGGSGYCRDYPIEQYIRDQKIDTLYEGTTSIQALDLAFRKIGRDGGATLRRLIDRIKADLALQTAGDPLLRSRELIATAIADTEATLMALMQKMGESLHHVGLHGVRVLFGLAELMIAWRLLVNGMTAQRALELGVEGESEGAFYQGKIAACDWFCSQVLPQLSLNRRLVEQSDIAVMQLAEAVF
ncbi:MAG: acyl-CoA dehydrogenase [Deltaproteobacteria bacterium]|nr:acyl-CoA dehydrogenase [Deltaproteobacteria bacterium]